LGKDQSKVSWPPHHDTGKRVSLIYQQQEVFKPSTLDVDIGISVAVKIPGDYAL
jgi:hypothetical protein